MICTDKKRRTYNIRKAFSTTYYRITISDLLLTFSIRLTIKTKSATSVSGLIRIRA
jgi:hypothetical protein